MTKTRMHPATRATLYHMDHFERADRHVYKIQETYPDSFFVTLAQHRVTPNRARRVIGPKAAELRQWCRELDIPYEQPVEPFWSGYRVITPRTPEQALLIMLRWF